MKKVKYTLVLVAMLLLGIVPFASAQGPVGSWASGIACRNLDTASQAQISISFYPEGNGSSVLNYSDTIPANGSKNYYTPSSPSGLPAGFLGAAVISSDAEISCSVNTQTTNNGTTSSPYRIGTSSGFSDSQTASKMFAPQVLKGLGGFNSYIAVQNTSDANVTVQVSYKDRNGASIAAATETVTIPGYSNKIFYQDSNGNLPSGFLGSAEIEATSPAATQLAVTVNFYNAGTSPAVSQLHSYNGFSTGANELVVPRVVRKYYGYNGGMSIQNVGSVATTATITYKFGGNTYTQTTPQIQPGASAALYMPNVAELNAVDALPISQRSGSATVKANAAGAEIVAIINEDNRGNASDNDGNAIPSERQGQGSTYNAFLPSDGTSTMVLPQITSAAGGIFSGGFQFASSNGTAATCTASYSGTSVTQQLSLPADGAVSVYAPSVANLPSGFNSSVTVSCPGSEIVGIFNLSAAVGTGRVGDSFTQANGLNTP